MVYTIKTGIYHGIYYLSGTWTYCCLMVYSKKLEYTMVYTVVRVLYTMVYTSLTYSCRFGWYIEWYALFFWYIAWHEMVCNRVKVGCMVYT